jgi:hypothetical protein
VRIARHLDIISVLLNDHLFSAYLNESSKKVLMGITQSIADEMELTELSKPSHYCTIFSTSDTDSEGPPDGLYMLLITFSRFELKF